MGLSVVFNIFQAKNISKKQLINLYLIIFLSYAGLTAILNNNIIEMHTRLSECAVSLVCMLVCLCGHLSSVEDSPPCTCAVQGK